MRSVERAPGVAVGERVFFWVTLPRSGDEHWQEGVINRILRYHSDFLLEIDSFTARPVYRWLSEVEKGHLHVT